MEREASASVLLARLILATAAKAGIAPEHILSAAGITGSVLEDADARVPYSAIERAWDEAVRRTGDEAFALRAAENVTHDAFRVLEYLVRSSDTLRNAFQQIERYYRLVHDSVTVKLVEGGDEARFIYGGKPEQVPAQAADLALALAVLRGRALTGVSWAPREVRFRRPAPRDDSAWMKLFRSPVKFGQPENALVLDPATLHLPVTSADPTLRAILDRHAEELLARLPRVDDFVEQVRQRVTANLSGGEPDLEDIAAQLAVTPRTLQRRLKDHGTTYKVLLEELRRELATRYLRDQRMEISEVAFLLGFSEPSAFHRAFKRWTGVTPQAFRNEK